MRPIAVQPSVAPADPLQRDPAGELLREVARLYTRAQREVADCCRTTSTQCHLLVELGRSGPVPQVELGQRLCLEKSWVSRAVDGLAARGLVKKEPNPLDARSWLVTLTVDGVDRLQALNHTLDTHAAQLLGRLSARDRRAVERSLRLLLEALRQGGGGDACGAPLASAWAVMPRVLAPGPITARRGRRRARS
jgi:DNA-binding MarR family transcriptional regulator